MNPLLLAFLVGKGSRIKAANAPAQTEVPAEPVKEAAEDTHRDTIVELLFLNGNLRICHWRASTKTNEHKALGDLYEAIDGHVDDFIEELMGLEGKRDMPTKSDSIGGGKDFKDVIKGIRTCVDKLCKAKSPDLANIAADMLQAVNKASYLLEL